MNRKFLSVVAALILTLTACVEEPMQTKSTENPKLPVGILFEVDGCTVYRFKDAGHYIYFAKCIEPKTGKVSASTYSSYSTSCGKSCIETVGFISTSAQEAQ